MGLIFANPWGLLALLAIPLVLLIHALQRKRRILPTSTLFLWQRIDPASTPGRRLERLLPSLPLLFQILAVLLLTWVLTQPRWLRSELVQPVVLVIDESASVSAFLDQAPVSLEPVLRRLEGAAYSSVWTVLPSHPGSAPLYQGSNRREALDAVRQFSARRPTHDPSPALLQALRLAGSGGVVLFLTDREPPSLPEGVGVHAFGEPFPHVGFAGVQLNRAEDWEWSVLLRNYSDTPQTRQWRLRSGDLANPWEEVALPANGSVILRGGFPPDEDQVRLEISGEALFSLDQELPLVRPLQRPLPMAWNRESAETEFFQHFLGRFPSWRPVRDEDSRAVRLIQHPSTDFTPPTPAVLWLPPLDSPEPSRRGLWLRGEHPLTERLSFDGLNLPTRPGLTLSSLDQVLLWDDEEAIIAVRGTGRGALLRWAFSPLDGNAARHPSLLILLSRFLEDQREYFPGFSRENVETGQRLKLALPDPSRPFSLVRESTGESTSFPPYRAHRVRAPLEPGFFHIQQDDEIIFSGAAHFAETREADFRPARSFHRDPPGEDLRILAQSRADFYRPLWLIALLLVFLANWHFSRTSS